MDKYIGKLIGNTGNPNDIKIALEDSFSAKRGEFVKIKHKESMDDQRLMSSEELYLFQEATYFIIPIWGKDYQS